MLERRLDGREDEKLSLADAGARSQVRIRRVDTGQTLEAFTVRRIAGLERYVLSSRREL